MTALFLSGHKTGELYGISVSLDKARAVPRLLSRKDAVVHQEVARIGSWEWDVKNDVLNWSEAAFRVFAIDPIAFDKGSRRPPRLPFASPWRCRTDRTGC